MYLSYKVGNCGWTPQYTVRGRTAQKTFELRYSALVRQMSGEDWKDVKLTLSTASPSIAATRPMLTPLHIVSVDPTRLDGRGNPQSRPAIRLKNRRWTTRRTNLPKWFKHCAAAASHGSGTGLRSLDLRIR